MAVATFLPSVTRMSLEIMIGRGLAMCAHPMLAWRVLSPGHRSLLVGAYFGASYVTVLVSLLVLQK
jgi:hypothetical protein